MFDPAIDKQVTLRGLRFHYREYAPAAPRRLRRDLPVIVLLHGLASTSRIWITVAPLLARRYRVLALDQRGHGESAKPDGPYDFKAVVGDLAAFVVATGVDRAVIVGHSWGGNVALQYAATHPRRTAALVLTDGGFLEIAGRPGATWERAEEEMAPPELTHLTPEQLIEGAKRWELGRIWSDEVQAALLANFEVTEAGTIRPRLSRENHMRIVRALWDQRPSELYRRVRAPVLFVAAERHVEGRAAEWVSMKREAIARAQGLLADCEVRWFEDTIHDIPLQRPLELARTIESFVRWKAKV
jgi:pimeloyl-ACP methyl ester carboxylesterase